MGNMHITERLECKALQFANSVNKGRSTNLNKAVLRLCFEVGDAAPHYEWRTGDPSVVLWRLLLMFALSMLCLVAPVFYHLLLGPALAGTWRTGGRFGRDTSVNMTRHDWNQVGPEECPSISVAPV